jgi:hypothetical protein
VELGDVGGNSLVHFDAKDSHAKWNGGGGIGFGEVEVTGEECVDGVSSV